MDHETIGAFADIGEYTISSGRDTSRHCRELLWEEGEFVLAEIFVAQEAASRE
ncbi:hypothetical protein LRE75_34345 [Streptomyces sp. 372A]